MNYFYLKKRSFRSTEIFKNVSQDVFQKTASTVLFTFIKIYCLMAKFFRYLKKERKNISTDHLMTMFIKGN